MQYINHIGYCGRDDSSDYLAHYGVIGMKWGIHKAQAYRDTAIGIQARKKKRSLQSMLAQKRITRGEYSDAKRKLRKDTRDLYEMSKEAKKAHKQYAKDLRKSGKAKGMKARDLYKDDREQAHKQLGLDSNKKLTNLDKAVNSRMPIGTPAQLGVLGGLVNLAQSRHYANKADRDASINLYNNYFKEEKKRRRR